MRWPLGYPRTALSPLLSSTYHDSLQWSATKVEACGSTPTWHSLEGYSCPYIFLASGGQAPLVTYLGISSREPWAFQALPLWRMEKACCRRWVPAGQCLLARLRKEAFPGAKQLLWREMTSCGWEPRYWRSPGPRSLRACLGNSSFPCSLLKGNYVTAGTRQLSFVNIFFSCVMSENDTYKPCLWTAHSGITGMSQSSFKNDVAI